MQIQALQSSAALTAAASVQAAAKEHSTIPTASATDIAVSLATELVGESAQANADRDAQGGGFGLGKRQAKNNPIASKQKVLAEDVVESGLEANLPEPPSQLDILG